MAVKRLLIGLFFISGLSGCATSPMDDNSVVMAFNDRLTNIEKKLHTEAPSMQKFGNGELTEGQKEFIRVMMDYLRDNSE